MCVPEFDLLFEDVLHPGLHEGGHGLREGRDPGLLRQGLHPLQHLANHTLSCRRRILTRASGKICRRG